VKLRFERRSGLMTYTSFPTFGLSDGMSNLTHATSQREVGMSSENDPKVLGHRVQKFLRDRHPVKTAANAAAATGLSEHRVSKWLEQSSAPSGAAIVALTAAYGPEFLAAVMPESCAWLDESVRAARLARVESELDALQRRARELSGGAAERRS
jgi:DNA-binding transcriptional regulator YiaG